MNASGAVLILKELLYALECTLNDEGEDPSWHVEFVSDRFKNGEIFLSRDEDGSWWFQSEKPTLNERQGTWQSDGGSREAFEDLCIVLNTLFINFPWTTFFVIEDRPFKPEVPKDSKAEEINELVF